MSLNTCRFINNFRMYILYASKSASIKPLDRFAELSCDTKNGKIPRL